MLGGIFILILTGFITFAIIGRLKRQHPIIDAGLLRKLFYYHTLLFVVYFLYALFNPSDSRRYYSKVLMAYRGPDWFSFYGTSTTFIEFLAYPFVRYFGFSYEAMMVLFGFFGFIGFLYLYIFFKENIKFRHDIFGYDLLTIFFFLPNLHFWSNSLGKGSIIFMGIGLFFFGISRISSRWVYVLIGGIIIYHVRPHIMAVVLVSSAMGFVFSSKGISLPLRFVFLAGAGIAFFYIYRDVLNLVGIEEGEFLTEGLDLSRRAGELTKATSGIDINSYSLPEKLFAFLYRPLFIDAPGILGLIVSFENVFYLLITLKLVNLRGLYFVFSGNFLVKSAFFSFITVSLALAQIAGNLGLAMRQKSQIMILFLFVIISFLDEKKMIAYKKALLEQARKKRMAALTKAKAL
jgi:hypothetical protein